MGARRLSCGCHWPKLHLADIARALVDSDVVRELATGTVLVVEASPRDGKRIRVGADFDVHLKICAVCGITTLRRRRVDGEAVAHKGSEAAGAIVGTDHA